MRKKLSKRDLAYNAVVEAIDEQTTILNDAINERNRLAFVAEVLIPLKAYLQYKIVGA
jgi:hypothetical protein